MMDTDSYSYIDQLFNTLYNFVIMEFNAVKTLHLQVVFLFFVQCNVSAVLKWDEYLNKVKSN